MGNVDRTILPFFLNFLVPNGLLIFSCCVFVSFTFPLKTFIPNLRNRRTCQDKRGGINGGFFFFRPTSFLFVSNIYI